MARSVGSWSAVSCSVIESKATVYAADLWYTRADIGEVEGQLKGKETLERRVLVRERKRDGARRKNIRSQEELLSLRRAAWSESKHVGGGAVEGATVLTRFLLAACCCGSHMQAPSNNSIGVLDSVWVCGCLSLNSRRRLLK